MENFYRIPNDSGLCEIGVKVNADLSDPVRLFLPLGRIFPQVDSLQVCLGKVSYPLLLKGVRSLGITRLNITYSFLTEKELLSLCECLVENTGITHLGFNGSNLGRVKGAWKPISLALRRANIISLDLDNNDIRDLDLPELLENSSLQQLSIHQTDISQRTIKGLSQILPATQLRTLVLDGMALSSRIYELMSGVQNSKISELWLSRNSLHSHAPLTLIGQSLRKCRHLKILRITENYIDDDDAKELLLGVEGSTLTELEMSSLKMASYELDEAALAVALGRDSTLQRLNLRKSRVTWSANFSECLRNSPLQHLDLNNIFLTQASCDALAAVLPQTSLLSLNLGANNINGRRIAEALLNGSQLQSLNMDDTQLDLGACQAFAATFKGTTLRELSILPPSKQEVANECWECLRNGLIGDDTTLAKLWFFQDTSKTITIPMVRQLLIDAPQLHVGFFNRRGSECNVWAWFILMPFRNRIHPFPEMAIDFALNCRKVTVLSTLLGAIAVSRLNSKSPWRSVPKELVRNLCILLYGEKKNC